jgi:acetyl-CoA acetyltransferase
MNNKVYIIGIGMTKFGKFLNKSIKDLSGEVIKYVLNDCNLEINDIEAAWFSNSAWGILNNQHCIRGQVALSANGIDEIPIINVENACAGGSTSLYGAWMAIRAGLYNCCLAIGVEKMYHTNKKVMMQSFITGTDVERTTKLIEQLKKIAEIRNRRVAKKNVGECENEESKEHSAFMDLYAAAARAHMKRYNTTQHQLAAVAAKNHNNSTLNPLAQYTFSTTIKEVMNDYIVTYPLTRAMCAPIGDGAAAAIVCSEKFLKEHFINRSILIRASVLQSGSWVKNTISKRTAYAAYSAANVSPKDINIAEVHDATAFGEIHQIEELGFCPVGQGGPFTESGATAIDGIIPINTSGGLISRGHPIAATGLAQIYELVIQLRAEAGKRQVNNLRFALAQNGGGNIGFGEAAMCIHILEKV